MIVSLVKSESHYEGVYRSLSLLETDLKEKLSKISSLVIKINLVITKTPRYNKGVELATTPLQSVKSFVDFISPFYNGEITIAEGSTWGKTEDGFDMYGFTELADENSKIKLLNVKEDETVTKSVTYQDGQLVLPFSKTMLEAPFLVSITRPKTHCSTFFSASIKNVVVGAINGRWKDRLKIHKGELIRDVLASLSEIVYPDFSIVDGTVGMEGNGPIRGTPIKSAWTLASFNPLVVDVLTARLMDFDFNKIPYLKLISSKKFGTEDITDNIKVVGEKPNDLITPYVPHRKFKKLLK